MSDDAAVPAPPVPGYAGHADEVARRLSDQQVRAWAGELLAGLRERLPPGEARERLDSLLVRCEFGDQHVVRALEDESFSRPELVALVESYDHKVVDAAKAAAAAPPEEVMAALGVFERFFDERTAAISEHLKG
jgi:hypothetical protein